MKRYLYLLLPLTMFLTVACNNDSTDDSSSEPTAEKSRIHSHLVFSRGHEAGRRALAFERDSKEREAELLRAHAIISALEDNGYIYSAADFRAGLFSAIDAGE